MNFTAYYKSDVGLLKIVCTDSHILQLLFVDNIPAEELQSTPNVLSNKAFAQIEEYLSGRRKTFDLPIELHGTPFQLSVWNALLTIPYCETRSYKQIAEQIGNPKASRAVGLANNRNPIAIIVPCHRVVGHNGKLVGYAGGLDRKDFLLRVESGGGLLF